MADNFVPGQLNRVKNLDRYPGGKGINIALMLSAMGIETYATGFLGHAAGRFFTGHLQKSGITTNFVYINDITRHNYFIIDDVNDTRTLIDEEGPEITPDELERFRHNFKRLLQRSKIVIIAGSNPRGVPKSFCCELLQMANEAGAKTILNTEEESMIPCMDNKPYLILPDLRTSEHILGIPIDSDESRYKVACSLLGKGVSIALVTFDDRSYLLSTPDECLLGSPADVNILTTLKSGDGMLAGIAYELANGNSIREAFKTGMASSIAASTRFEGFFDSIDDIRMHVKNIEVREVTP